MAFVKVFLESSPPYISFGLIRKGENFKDLTRQARIVNCSMQPITVKKVEVSPNIFEISFSPKRINPGEFAVLHIKLVPQLIQSRKRIVGLITIVSDVKEKPYLKIPVRGSIVP